MNEKITSGDHPAADHIHPFVYGAVIGLSFWFVAAAVLGFGADGYADFLLVVVGGFIVIAVTIPSVLWLVWYRHYVIGADQDEKDSRGHRESFRDWAACELNTWQGHLSARNAAVEILLPIAAVAFGMTAFGIVLHYAAYSAA